MTEMDASGHYTVMCPAAPPSGGNDGYSGAPVLSGYRNCGKGVQGRLYAPS
jgi:hypothetical protein